MKQLKTVKQVRAFRAEGLPAGQKLALVPTMGFLHQGHLSLIELAKQVADQVIVSIFVNPGQFNQTSDFEKYPRDTPGDLRLLESLGVEAVFLPDAKEVYPQGDPARIELEGITQPWEGEYRPGHFRGVTTVVGILFNICQPDIAIFGEKDFQQLTVVKRMVEALHWPVEIISAELVREEDGLAMSSRNVRLSPAERKEALSLSRALFIAQQEFENGVSDVELLLKAARAEISKEIKVEYLACVDPETLETVEQASANDRIILAANVGELRLIDNLAL